MTAALLLCLAAAPTADPPGRLYLEPGDVISWLVAEYRSLVDKDATVTRTERKPAFYLGRSSPHPRIPPGPFEVTWSGVISIKEAGAITFSAFVGGEVTVTLDGVVVLDGKGQTDTTRITAKAPLKRESGYYTFAVRFRSLADVPARLQIWWEGDAFAREPLPAWRLGHRPALTPRTAVNDEVAAMGREFVTRYGCARC